MIKFSIILISYNRRKIVLNTLEKIANLPQDNYEVILIDNGSGDGTCDKVKQEFPEVKLISLKDNLGIEAYNIGFEQARGQYIVVIDDDSYPHQQALDRAKKEFFRDPDLALIAGRINNYDETIQWPLHLNHKKRQQTNLFAGCGFIVRKNIFKEVGFYPIHYFIFFNENYVANKILLKNKKILYNPEIIFYHQAPPEQRFNARRIYYMTRNHFWNIIQFCPKNKFILSILRHWNYMLIVSWEGNCLKSFF